MSGDALFAGQDSIGKILWGRFALRAGMSHRDTTILARCMTEEITVARLKADSVAASSIGARGTPTVLVNEWKLYGTPSFGQLDSAIRSALSEQNK